MQNIYIQGLDPALQRNMADRLAKEDSEEDASQARLGTIDPPLAPGGGLEVLKQPEVQVNFNMSGPNGERTSIADDWRVKVSIGKNNNIFYKSANSGILAPLKSTGGVIFPYTPSITTSYAASYSSQKQTHSNYPAYFYESSEVQAIQLSGEFTVQNSEEGKYLLACIYFFRAASKMFYGLSQSAGNPPPVVFLDGYGSHYFPHVPCVLTSFTHVMGGDVDYVEIPTLAQTTRLPTVSQIQIQLQPIYSRKSIAEFNLDEFAAGRLLDRGFL